MRRRLAALILLLSLPRLALAQESAALADDPDDWSIRVATIEDTNAQMDGPPLTAPLLSCAGTACGHLTLVVLNDAEAEQLQRDFAAITDGASERRAIGRAIARFETYVGERNGTWADAPGNRHGDEDDPGQLDCVSETANTHSYLDRLGRAGLLLHHRLGRMVMRFSLLLQHVAQTIVDDAGQEYAVDSWVGANGEEPEIVPYDEWRAEWGA